MLSLYEIKLPSPGIISQDAGTRLKELPADNENALSPVAIPFSGPATPGAAPPRSLHQFHVEQKRPRERPISSAHGAAATVSKWPRDETERNGREKRRRSKATKKPSVYRIAAGEWEIYKLTARRRAHVQYIYIYFRGYPRKTNPFFVVVHLVEPRNPRLGFPAARPGA